MPANDFYTKYGPVAAEAAQGTGVFPETILAQAALESGNGTSDLATKHNNLFGIKATPDWKGATATYDTAENTGTPQAHKEKAAFRSYDTPEQSIKDHIAFLQKNPRYADALKAKTPQEQLQAIAKAGYATDANYGQKLDKQLQAIAPTPKGTTSYTPFSNEQIDALEKQNADLVKGFTKMNEDIKAGGNRMYNAYKTYYDVYNNTETPPQKSKKGFNESTSNAPVVQSVYGAADTPDFKYSMFNAWTKDKESLKLMMAGLGKAFGITNAEEFSKRVGEIEKQKDFDMLKLSENAQKDPLHLLPDGSLNTAGIAASLGNFATQVATLAPAILGGVLATYLTGGADLPVLAEGATAAEAAEWELATAQALAEHAAKQETAKHIGTSIASMMIGGVQQLGDGFDDAKARGLNDDQAMNFSAMRAAAVSPFYGIAPTIFMGRLTNAATGALADDAISTWLEKGATKEAFNEVIPEFGQGITKGVVNRLKNAGKEAVIESANLGTVSGLITGVDKLATQQLAQAKGYYKQYADVLNESTDQIMHDAAHDAIMGGLTGFALGLPTLFKPIIHPTMFGYIDKNARNPDKIEKFKTFIQDYGQKAGKSEAEIQGLIEDANTMQQVSTTYGKLVPSADGRWQVFNLLNDRKQAQEDTKYAAGQLEHLSTMDDALTAPEAERWKKVMGLNEEKQKTINKFMLQIGNDKKPIDWNDYQKELQDIHNKIAETLTNEKPIEDAEEIRSDTGQVHEGGEGEEILPNESGEDLQQPTETGAEASDKGKGLTVADVLDVPGSAVGIDGLFFTQKENGSITVTFPNGREEIQATPTEAKKYLAQPISELGFEPDEELLKIKADEKASKAKAKGKTEEQGGGTPAETTEEPKEVVPIESLQGKKVTYKGKTGILSVDEGGKVSFESDNKIYDIPTEADNRNALDYGIEPITPKYNISDISESGATVNGTKYAIHADAKGNIIGLSPENNPRQVIKNEKLLTAVEIERNKLEVQRDINKFHEDKTEPTDEQRTGITEQSESVSTDAANGDAARAEDAKNIAGFDETIEATRVGGQGTGDEGSTTPDAELGQQGNIENVQDSGKSKAAETETGTLQGDEVPEADKETKAADKVISAKKQIRENRKKRNAPGNIGAINETKAYNEAIKGFEPANLREYIMRWLAGGGQISSKDFAEHVQPEKSEEFKTQKWQHSPTAKSLDERVQEIQSGYEHEHGGISEKQFEVRNELLDALNRYDKKSDVRKELIGLADDRKFAEENGMPQRMIDEAQHRYDEEQRILEVYGLPADTPEMQEQYDRIDEQPLTEQEINSIFDNIPENEKERFYQELADEGQREDSETLSERGGNEEIRNTEGQKRAADTQKLETAKERLSKATSDYNAAKKALDTDLANKQGGLFEGKEQKLFDDTAEMEKRAEAAKKEMHAAQADVDKYQKLVDENLVGQQELLQKSGGKSIHPETASFIHNIIQKAFPNIGVNFVTEGDFLGRVNKDGTVDINVSKVTDQTQVHEFGHVWTSWAKKFAPEIYKRGMKLAEEQTELKEAVKAEYPELNDHQLNEEVLARTIGESGAEHLETLKDRTLAERIGAFAKGLFNKLGDYLKRKLGLRDTRFDNLQNMGFKEFAGKVAQELLSGRQISDVPSEQLAADGIARYMKEPTRVRRNAREDAEPKVRLEVLPMNVGRIKNAFIKDIGEVVGFTRDEIGYTQEGGATGTGNITYSKDVTEKHITQLLERYGKKVNDAIDTLTKNPDGTRKISMVSAQKLEDVQRMLTDAKTRDSIAELVNEVVNPKNGEKFDAGNLSPQARNLLTSVGTALEQADHIKQVSASLFAEPQVVYSNTPKIEAEVRSEPDGWIKRQKEISKNPVQKIALKGFNKFMGMTGGIREWATGITGKESGWWQETARSFQRAEGDTARHQHDGGQIMKPLMEKEKKGSIGISGGVLDPRMIFAKPLDKVEGRQLPELFNDPSMPDEKVTKAEIMDLFGVLQTQHLEAYWGADAAGTVPYHIVENGKRPPITLQITKGNWERLLSEYKTEYPTWLKDMENVANHNHDYIDPAFKSLFGTGLTKITPRERIAFTRDGENIQGKVRYEEDGIISVRGDNGKIYDVSPDEVALREKDEFGVYYPTRRGIGKDAPQSFENVNHYLDDIGSFRTRTPGGDVPLLGGDYFQVQQSAIDNAAKFGSWALPFHNADVMTGVYGKGVLDKSQQEWYNKFKQHAMNPQENISKLEKMFYRGFVGHAIGLNPFTALKHLSTLVLANNVIPQKYLVASFGELPKAAANLASNFDILRGPEKSWSPLIQRMRKSNVALLRMTGGNPELMALMDGNTKVRVKTPHGDVDFSGKDTMNGMKCVLTATDAVVWSAAEKYVADAFPHLKEGTQEHFDKVEQLFMDGINDSQPAFGEANRSMLSKGGVEKGGRGTINRAFTLFSGQLTAQWNAFGRRSIMDLNNPTPKNHFRTAKAAANIFLANAAMVATIDVLRQQALGKKKDDISEDFVTDFIREDAAGIPFLGRIAEEILDKKQKGYWATDINAPVLQPFNELTTGIANELNGKDGMKHILNSVAEVTGVPGVSVSAAEKVAQ